MVFILKVDHYWHNTALLHKLYDNQLSLTCDITHNNVHISLTMAGRKKNKHQHNITRC